MKSFLGDGKWKLLNKKKKFKLVGNYDKFIQNYLIVRPTNNIETIAH